MGEIIYHNVGLSAVFLLPFNTRSFKPLNKKVSKRPEKVHSQPCYITVILLQCEVRKTATVWKCQVKTIPAISRGRLQAPLLLLPSQSAGNTSPAHPGHSTGLPCALGKQKGTPGPQRLGSREIKEPSIFGEEKEKGRDCSQQGHHPQGCENSVCQANSVTGFCGQMGIHPWKGGSSNTPSLLSSL